MNHLTRFAAEKIAELEVTVRLRTRAGEAKGGGYTAQVVRGTMTGKGIKYPKPRFDFTGAIGEVIGFSVEMAGGEVVHKDFAEPFFVGGAGDWISVNLDAKPNA